MSEYEDTGARLARGLHEEAEGVRPDPALQSILARTRRTPARSSRSQWWPVAGAALATGGLVAVVAFVALDDDPTVEPPVASTPTSPVTVYFTNPDGKVVSESVDATDTGDPGLDAVNALLGAMPADPDYSNGWACDADHETTSVSAQDGILTVDLTPPQGVDDLVGCTSGEGGENGREQQMVYTVQTAMDSKLPVQVRIVGRPTGEVDRPDPYALAPVQIESPAQGESVSSPVTVSGQSATFEANVAWRVKQDGEVVKDGFTTGEGANGVLGPFEFTVTLPPGDYMVEAFEFSAEDGKVINLDSKDFTVE